MLFYDKLKRLKTVTQGGQTAVYEYDTNGNRKTLTIGNVVTSYDYNLANWATSLENKVGGQTQSGYTYSYKLDGNQAYKSEAITGQTVTYAYDTVGRLKSETYAGTVAGNGAVVYNYDKAGNRETMTDTRTGTPIVTAYHYDPNNRLGQTDKSASDGTVVTQRYGYDRNGNQTSMLQEVLHPAENPPATAALGFGGEYELSEYDAFGRMVTVKTDTVEAEYTYNPNGLRHSKTVNGETRVHVWDGGQMAAEVLEDGSVARYVRGVNLLWSDKASGKETYLHNAHGDVVAISSTTGVREYSYDAFGNQLQQGVPIAWELVTTTADTNPFRYCGEYFDSETGNVYLRARYYNTATGRFTSEDPIRDGRNWYTYCSGNPIRFIDPSGLKNEKLIELVMALGGTVTWDQETSTATVTILDQEVTFTAGTDGAYISEDRMYVDGDKFAEAFGATYLEESGEGYTGFVITLLKFKDENDYSKGSTLIIGRATTFDLSREGEFAAHAKMDELNARRDVPIMLANAGIALLTLPSGISIWITAPLTVGTVAFDAYNVLAYQSYDLYSGDTVVDVNIGYVTGKGHNKASTIVYIFPYGDNN